MTSSPDWKARPLPKRFVLELTRRCNHACRYCYRFWPVSQLRQGPAEAPELTADEIEAIVDKLRAEAPVEAIALSGGEPLLRDDVPRIVSFIESRGIAAAVITNGGLLTESLIDRLDPRATLEITLLSHRPEIHDRLAGRRGAWDAAVTAMANLRKARRPFVGVFIATRQNAADLRKAAEVLVAMGAQGLMYNRLNLGKEHRRNGESLLPTVETLRENLHHLDQLSADYGLATAVSVVIEPCVIDFREYPRVHFGWCPRGGEDSYFTIDPQGNVRICNHSPNTLGNIRTTTFREMYDAPGVRAFAETLPEECADCPAEFRDVCGGGCRAAAEQWYGTTARVDPFVQLRGVTRRAMRRGHDVAQETETCPSSKSASN